MADFNDLEAALDTLPDGAAARIANASRTPQDYLLGRFLPERRMYDYEVNAGNMVITSTMAPMVGMDSPYPEGGHMAASSFKENTAKLAIRMTLPEAAQRRIQNFVMRQRAAGEPTIEGILRNYFNFVDKLLLQPHHDTTEWLRSRAMFTGKIDWTYQGKRLLVDYGFDPDFMLPDLVGNNGFGGSTSKFWDTISKINQLANYDVQAYLCHPRTAEAIVNNPVNRIEVTSIEKVNKYVQRYRFRQLIGQNERPQSDVRYNVELLTYSLQGEVLDEANPGKTKKLPMIQPGEFAAVTNGSENQFVLDEGSTEEPRFEDDLNIGGGLGYVHLAPTTEGDGVPGRWADAYRPQRQRWVFEGVSVSNTLPVIPSDDRIITVKTALPA